MTQLLAVDVAGGVEDAWRTIATFLPKLAGFLVILLVGFLVARVLRRVTDTVLERVGFDRAVERGGVRQALARSRYDASDLIAKLVYYAALLVTLVWAFGVFGPNPISDLLRGVVAFLPRLAVAIVIVVVAAAIARGVRDLVEGALGGLSYGRAVATVCSVFLLALGVIAALNQIGIATSVATPVLITVLATLGGVVVVGVGGGLIRPMEQRWAQWLDLAERDSGAVREQLRGDRSRSIDLSAGETYAASGAYPADSAGAGYDDAGTEGWYGGASPHESSGSYGGGYGGRPQPFDDR